MTKRKTNKTSSIKLVLLAIAILMGSFITFAKTSGNKSFANKLGVVFAEDEEDEGDEGDDRENDHDNDKDDVIYETKEVSQNVTNVPASQVQPVVRYIKVVDIGFDRDSDGDGLVDAIDPNPTIQEKEFYTDDDGDGVPNVADANKGENDFLFIDFDDVNKNGILDSLEIK